MITLRLICILSITMTAAALLRPLHQMVAETRHYTEQARWELYTSPGAAAARLCAQETTPTSCVVTLSWRVAGEWENLCERVESSHVLGEDFGHERYYRLVVSCRLAVGPLSLPFPLLEATIIR